MSGYSGFGPEAGTFIPEEAAFAYAFERCTKGTAEDKKEFEEMLVEWFYSKNWVKEDD